MATKKYTIMKSIIILFTLFLLGSCTVTKRVHNPGWHVEFYGSQKRHNESVERAYACVSNEEDNIEVAQNIEVGYLQNEPSKILETQVDLRDKETTYLEENGKGRSQSDFHQRKLTKDVKAIETVETVESSETQRFLPTSLKVALILVIGSILSFVLGVVNISWILYFLAVALAIVSAILVLKSYSIIIKNKKVWKGRVLVWILFGISMLISGLGLFAGLLLASGFSGIEFM